MQKEARCRLETAVATIDGRTMRLPAARLLLVSVAVGNPLTKLSVPAPRVFLPSLKITIPVGKPPPGAVALTVAVSVTGWPETQRSGEATAAMVVSALATVSAAALLTLAVILPFPQ